MPEFRRHASINVSPDAAFRYLSDPGNLPDYVATMTLARPAAAAERLHVAADVQGRHEEGDAAFRADPQARRMEWGAPADHGYHGSLEVSGDGDGDRADVALALSTARDEDRVEVERALDETMANIKSRLES